MRSLPSANREFVYGSFVYQYQLIKHERKTLSLTVTPQMEIFVKSPLRADEDRIEQFLQKKWFWLEKQLSFFGKYKRKTYRREYVSGENFHYLGRQYKLVVRKSSESKVSLTRGALLVHTNKSVTDSKYTRKLIDGWYQSKLEDVFEERYAAMMSRFEYSETPGLAIRDMKLRWGSFSKNKIILNPKLIQLPKQCIDYVIVHELCHVKYKNHDKKFFKLLDEKYPKWEKVKDRLELMGASLK